MYSCGGHFWGIEQTAAVTTAETAVTESEPKEYVESDFLVKSLNYYEAHRQIRVPDDKIPTNPDQIKEEDTPRDQYFAIFNRLSSGSKEIGKYSVNENYRIISRTDVNDLGGGFELGVYEIFRISDFDFSPDQPELAEAFGKKFVQELKFDKYGEPMPYYISFDILSENQVYNDGEIMICDMTEILLTDGQRYEDWVVGKPKFSVNNPNYDYSWILNFRKYMSENFEDCVKKID